MGVSKNPTTDELVPASTAAPPTSSVDASAPSPTQLQVVYEPHACTDGPTYEMAQVISTKVSSALSITGSCYIFGIVGGKWRKNRASLDPYQRIMALYSIYDILFSFFYYFLGSWMTPGESGWWGATGNATTCSIQGFFFFFGGNGVTWYQVMLSLQMLLLVAYDWRPRDFKEKIEYRMHCFIFVFAVTYASVPLFFEGYNPVCGTCTNYPLPWWCGNGDSLFGDGITECVRGNIAISDIYSLLNLVWIATATLFCTGSMIAIYRSVYKQEKIMAQFAYGNTTQEHHRQSKRIRKSMILYTSTFYICWILPTFAVAGEVPILRVVANALIPLMGFLNMLVFILPKCVKYQKEHSGTILPVAYFYVMFRIPIESIAKLVTPTGGTDQDPDVAEVIDDGIGLGRYNERVEAPAEDSVSASPRDSPGVIGGGIGMADDEEMEDSTASSLTSQALEIEKRFQNQEELRVNLQNQFEQLERHVEDMNTAGKTAREARDSDSSNSSAANVFTTNENHSSLENNFSGDR